MDKGPVKLIKKSMQRRIHSYRDEDSVNVDTRNTNMPRQPPAPEVVRHWSSEQLLEYVKPLFAKFREDQLLEFQNAEIDGELFIIEGTRKWFQETCCLKAGPAIKLEDEVKRIFDFSRPGNNTESILPAFKRPSSGEKNRNVDYKKIKLETDSNNNEEYYGPVIQRYPPGGFKITGTNSIALGPRVNNDQQARRSRIENFWIRLKGIHHSSEYYSVAGKSITLPFPSEAFYADQRFNMNDRLTTFEYFGRDCFERLYNRVMEQHVFQCGQGEFFLRGPHGSGKSNLLAALACLMMRQGIKVLYLPNAYHLAHNFVECVRSALLLTFGAADGTRQWLEKTNFPYPTDIIEACRKLEPKMFVIIDEYDIFDETRSAYICGKELDRDAKDETLRCIKHLAAGRFLIAASSRHPSMGTLNELNIDAGLTNIEMQAMWKQFNARSQFGVTDEQNKSYLEQLTSGIPALIAPLMNPKIKLNAEIDPKDEICQIYTLLWEGADKKNDSSAGIPRFSTIMSSFMLKISKDLQGSQDGTNRLLKTWVACLAAGDPVEVDENCVDWRFFRQQGSIINPTCGYVRECVALFIREMNFPNVFLSPTWTKGLERSGSNQFLQEFFVKHMIFAKIQKHGFPHIAKVASEDIECYTYVNSFDLEELKNVARRNGKAIGLFTRRIYHVNEVDCFIVSLDVGPETLKPKAHVLAVHVTLVDKSNDVEATFMRRWGYLVKELEEFIAESPVFMKIMGMGEKDSVWVSEKGPKMVRGEKVPGTPRYMRMYHNVATFFPDVGEILAKVRGHTLPQTSVGVYRASQESSQGGLEPAARTEVNYDVPMIKQESV